MNDVRSRLCNPGGKPLDVTQRGQPLFADRPVQVRGATGPRALTDRPVGGYANAFQPLPDDYVMGQGAGEDGETPLRDDLGVQRYLETARGWRAAGASVIGGCCGIGPDHIAALRQGLS